jgi:hypothetical protein
MTRRTPRSADGRRTRRRRSRCTVWAAALFALVSACGSSPTATGSSSSSTAPGGSSAAHPSSGVSVYWDQDEEQEYIQPPSSQPHVLVSPWDPNGQMCLLPDHSGRFVIGYDPTNPDGQGSNPGSKLPFKDPPDGIALYNSDGTFTGTTFYVPGKYPNLHQGGGSTNNANVGGDAPPAASDSNHFNDNSTFTGCAFDQHGNLYASDIATAQGSLPPPDSGRLVMWFGPDYKDSCIVLGPAAGGDGPHHVDGTGGLREPGTMTSDVDGNVYVPEAATMDASGQSGPGRVLRLDTSTVPQSPADCPDQLPKSPPTATTFITNPKQTFPLGIAIDPTCDCFAVSNVIGGDAVAWYGRDGHLLDRPAVASSTAYNPFGLAFAPDGSMYFIDIHISCKPDGCGTTDNEGALYHVTFDDEKQATVTKVAGGMSFPTSVTVCDATRQACPVPAHDSGVIVTEPPKTAVSTAGQVGQ